MGAFGDAQFIMVQGGHGTVRCRNGRGALKVEAAHLRRLPIPALSSEEWERLSVLGQALATGIDANVRDAIDTTVASCLLGRCAMEKECCELAELAKMPAYEGKTWPGEDTVNDMENNHDIGAAQVCLSEALNLVARGESERVIQQRLKRICSGCFRACRGGSNTTDGVLNTMSSSRSTDGLRAASSMPLSV
jgi:hypothetical protein